jgi:glutamyl-tRNA reductase
MFMMSTWRSRATSTEVMDCPTFPYTGRPRPRSDRQGQPQAVVAVRSDHRCRCAQNFTLARQRRSAPLIQQLNAKTDEWRAAEIVRAKSYWPVNQPTPLDALTRGLTQNAASAHSCLLHAEDAASQEATADTVRAFCAASCPKNTASVSAGLVLFPALAYAWRPVPPFGVPAAGGSSHLCFV